MRITSARLACLVVLAVLSFAQQPKAPPPALPGAEYSGMYSFLREGEFVQITVEEKGRVSGFVSRYGDQEGDRGAFLDHFFKPGKSKLDGNSLTFATETVHGVWFDFRGTIERGEGKKPGDEAFYVLKGTLTEYSTDENQKTSSRARDVALKSFPRDLSPAPPKKSDWLLQPKRGIPPTVFLPVQSKNPRDLAAGKLLVASRSLFDPNFARTVVLLVQYDAKGATGLILNRRTDVPLSRVFGGLKAARSRSDPVYLGGPVEIPSVFALLRSTAKPDGAEHIFDGVYMISTKTLFEKAISAQPDPGVLHVYLGYAGWTNDQLRKEVELGAWFIFQADTRTVFNSDPDSLWRQMIQKTELKLAGNLPADADPADQFLKATYR